MGNIWLLIFDWIAWENLTVLDNIEICNDDFNIDLWVIAAYRTAVTKSYHIISRLI